MGRVSVFAPAPRGCADSLATDLGLDDLAREPIPRPASGGSDYFSEDDPGVDASSALPRAVGRRWAGCAVRFCPRRRPPVTAQRSSVRLRAPVSSQERPAIPRKAGVEGSNPSVGLAPGRAIPALPDSCSAASSSPQATRPTKQRTGRPLAGPLRAPAGPRERRKATAAQRRARPQACTGTQARAGSGNPRR